MMNLAELRFADIGRIMVTGSIQSEEIIHHLLERTSAETGDKFLRALVRAAAQAMNVAGVWVTEYQPERGVLRAMAFWWNDHHVEDYEYPIQGTPCEQVIESKCLIHYPERVIELFPDDTDLVKLSAVSYAGVPLLGPDGTLLGHLSALDTKPFKLTDDVESVFRFFAARAAAEIVRLQAESTLRDSEKRFSRLFESAMDAIIELDHCLQIIRANCSAATLFGVSNESLLNLSLSKLLASCSAQKLSTMAQQLQHSGQSCTWIPGGLDIVRPDGWQFPAEATLSCFEVAGERCYSVILRNVQDQLVAEGRLRELEQEEEADIQSGIDDGAPLAEIMGSSSAIRAAVFAVRQVAPTQATVLITGETGTGKELVARAIHKASQRAAKPFISVNCAAIPASLCESELFGHERGAFTGASSRRVGRFELAHGGTIFLDEVGELPLELQPKLLRVLQEHEFEPVGSSQTRKVNVRVIAATNRDLSAEVAAGRFREDLFYRLNVFPVVVPPLRERGSDVEWLARSFIDRLSSRLGIPRPELTADCLRRLRVYHWPGNVRELENLIERAVILARDGTLSLRSVLPLDLLRTFPETRSTGLMDRVRTKHDLREIERETLIQALERAGWKVAGWQGAARALGIPPSTLASRMKSLNIQRPLRAKAATANSRTVRREIESGEKSLNLEAMSPHKMV
jgi:PAS domain S-box-containing protein